MPVVYSTGKLALPRPIANTSTWATYYQRGMSILETALSGLATMTATGSTVTLTWASGTNDQGKNLLLKVSGTLTANHNVVVATRKGLYLAWNNTSGNFTCTFKTSGGTGVAVKQGYKQWLYCDGVNVIPVSRNDGRSTATEIGVGIITATLLAASSVTTAKIADRGVTLAKIAGGSSYGRIIYTATDANFTRTDLARGTANQVLAMSTAANTLPTWKTPPYRAISTSTQIAISAGSTNSYTHGLTGISNKTDIKHIEMTLVCLSTDLGYTAGDIVFVRQLYGAAGSSDFGIIAIVDSLTVVKALVCTNGFELPNKSTRNWGVATANKWALIVSVYV